MWLKIPRDQEEAAFNKAIEFTGNTVMYGEWMLEVVNNWPIACENNLTASGINQQAWIGHAAAWMAIKSPEYITRLAWQELTDEQRRLANLQADHAIAEWKRRYAAGLEHGKEDATRKEYQTKLLQNLKTQI